MFPGSALPATGAAPTSPDPSPITDNAHVDPDRSPARSPGASRHGLSRLRILDRLHRSPTPLGLEELSEAAGLHPNTVRFHLDRLLAEGLVTRRTEPPTGPGRPRVAFTATARPDLDPRRRSFRMLAEMLADFLATSVPEAAARARGIGRAWGGRLVAAPVGRRSPAERPAVDELVRVLDQVGFAPVHTPEADGHRILLRHCPFLEVAEAHPEVACSVHQGLMDGVLAQLRAPLAADELRPFAVPGGCVAHLRPAPAEEL